MVTRFLTTIDPQEVAVGSSSSARYFYSTNAGGATSTLSTTGGGTGGGQQTCPSGIPIQAGVDAEARGSPGVTLSKEEVR